MAEDAEISRGHEGCEESTGQLGGCQGSVVKSETKQRFASCLFRMRRCRKMASFPRKMCVEERLC